MTILQPVHSGYWSKDVTLGWNNGSVTKGTKAKVLKNILTWNFESNEVLIMLIGSVFVEILMGKVNYHAQFVVFIMLKSGKFIPNIYMYKSLK
jgi:hypothetical protein